jgi:ATP-binding cassette subfamily B protein
LVNNIINSRSERIQAQLSNLSSFVQETFSGIRLIKAYVRENEVAGRFTESSLNYQRNSMDLVKVQALFYPIMLLLVGLSTIITVYVGGFEVINGHITAGNIAEFVVYVTQLTFPVMSLGWVTSLIQRAAASQKRINEFLHTEPEIKSGKTEVRLKGNIQFKNVSFTYPDTGIQALKNVNFELKKGELLAIIGKTGSGKSTLANLLMRMYDVQAGEICVEEQPIKNLNLMHYRSQIGFVPQEVFLFSDTIANNIAFGCSATLPEIETAAKQAAVHENINTFEKGYQTLLGERGITLSGGQKQRVSIARALVKKPSLLILDDSLSAVDTRTEEQILRNLDSYTQHSTTLIIAHRISSIKQANQILVLDGGEIIESGNHTQLLSKKGYYYELYQKQLLEEEIAEH